MALHPHLVRLRWRSRLWLTWGAAIVLAGTTAVVADGLVEGARRTRDGWGQRRTVLVATSPVAAGARLDAGVVRVEERPVALVPEGAAGVDAVGRVAAAALVAGEVVVLERLAPDGLSPLAATVPEGHRAVAVPAGPAVVALVPGDRVDLVVATDPSAGDAGPAVTVARRALVLAASDQATTVAVAVDELDLVVAALAAGAVVPALVGR